MTPAAGREVFAGEPRFDGVDSSRTRGLERTAEPVRGYSVRATAHPRMGLRPRQQMVGDVGAGNAPALRLMSEPTH